MRDDGPESVSGEIILNVCTTCRDAGDPDPQAERPGAILARVLEAALAARASAGDPLPIRVEPVACLSVCKRPCTLAASAPGRWTYVWGDIDPATHVEDILDGLAKYAASQDGVVPWRERPDIFKKGVVARIPPFPRRDAAE
ncbi:DUF1636 family protein [Salinarimonas ramus]|uniref:Metal-binding protein n=1 Tax=Salinarimonas ramus TaxID=690164 RepID=A0A917QGD5_9HYPH|nr:DUF1636 domain-containing protein [Salinarimonas ramus]GGK47755.1 metal-binding protein [Salinarimonas ramus]